jgi:hypothetical protein
LLNLNLPKGEEEGTFYVLHIIPLIFSLPSITINTKKKIVFPESFPRDMICQEDKILENNLNEHQIAFSIKNLFGGGKCK